MVDTPANGNGGVVSAPVAPAASPAPSTVPAVPAAPAAPQQQVSDIEFATRQMETDTEWDLPADPGQDQGWRPANQLPGAPPASRYPQPAQPQVVAQPAQQTQPIQPTTQTQPAQQTQQPASQDPQAAQIAQRVQQDPFGLQADMLQQQEQQYVQALAKEVYPVSQDDVDAFLSGDGSRISSALARVHVNAVGSVMRVMSQQMPVWVNNMMRLHRTAAEREDTFWKTNGFLDRTKHEKMAIPIARAFRQMNPNASNEEIDRAVGAMVAIAAGVQVPPGAYQPQATPQQSQMSQSDIRTPGPVVKRAPQAFQPAGTAAPSASRGAAPPNPWSEMAAILMADQAGALDNVT